MFSFRFRTRVAVIVGLLTLPLRNIAVSCVGSLRYTVDKFDSVTIESICFHQILKSFQSNSDHLWRNGKHPNTREFG